MATQMNIEWNGTTYTAEFNRKAVDHAERKFGITPESMQSSVLIIRMPELFHCSLLMHHPNIKQTTSEAIFKAIPNKLEEDENGESFVSLLASMYAEAFTSMYEDDGADEGKAVAWKVLK